MRARLEQSWPFLSHHFGLMPWHAGGAEILTYGEIDAYVEAGERLQKAQQEQHKKAR